MKTTYTNILFVCTANIDRSPTAEKLFRDVLNWDVKSAGTAEYAVKPVSKDLFEWADYIIAMEERHRERIIEINPTINEKIHVLSIKDEYYKNSEELVQLLKEKMELFFDLQTGRKK